MTRHAAPEARTSRASTADSATNPSPAKSSTRSPRRDCSSTTGATPTIATDPQLAWLPAARGLRGGVQSIETLIEGPANRDRLTAVWVGSGTRSCPQPKDDAFMEAQIRKGNVIEAGEVDYTYPFSPSDLRHYGLTPINGDCGHLDGVVSGYSGASPIWHIYMAAALKGIPDTWYTRPSDVVATGPGDDADFYLPGTEPGASTNCTYYGPVPCRPRPAPTVDRRNLPRPHRRHRRRRPLRRPLRRRLRRRYLPPDPTHSVTRSRPANPESTASAPSSGTPMVRTCR